MLAKWFGARRDKVVKEVKTKSPKSPKKKEKKKEEDKKEEKKEDKKEEVCRSSFFYFRYMLTWFIF